MDKRFCAEFTADYYGIKPGLTVTFPRLMSYLQEASIRHTDSTPHPMSWYSDNKFGYLTTNWHIVVEKYPVLHDKLIIHTWPMYFKGIICERYFEMRGADDSVYARAASKWVFMDLVRRRPCKPPEIVVAEYGPIYPPGFEHSFGFSSDISGMEKTSTDHFKVTRRDIDSNDHVNNVKYIEWAVDYMPDDVYDAYSICEAKVSYKKECVKNQKIFMETYLKNDGVPVILSVLKSSEEPDINIFEAYFKFTT